MPDSVDVIARYWAEVDRLRVGGLATEHSFRPALKTLLESLRPGFEAVNDPKRIACGAPDFIVQRGTVPVGYLETKDVGADLDLAAASDQLTRYRAALANLILTDYLDFRWYVGGELRLTARLEGRTALVLDLLNAFLNSPLPTITTPRDLAERLARSATLVRETILRALASEPREGPDSLAAQMRAFRKVLLHDLSPAQFADMYAQTICYGLFTARCAHASGQTFSRQNAPYDLPKTNPFLRRLFGHIAGPELDDRVVWIVDDIAETLNRAPIEGVLRDFGRQEGKADPVFHFYETFLAAYDPALRERRGVYYTPAPVVSYIVRSTDILLRRDFGLRDGLAHAARPGGKARRGGQDRPVLILDPAVGTGTFLYEVVRLIHERVAADAGVWPRYVADHLLPRLFGFELLMAPYTVAHMKLGLQLAHTGYDFRGDERLAVYLTNTLEEPHPTAGLPLFSQWLAEEANAAAAVKRDAPVMVVLGNPPYSGHSANRGQWINQLLRGFDLTSQRSTHSYFRVDGKPLGERNPKWLNDDYVKFMRFAQWRIERTGYGILAFITNNGYLENPTFRGMRQSLLDSFDDIYLLNLHGDSKKRERAPDGGPDENVFDIQQGVAIGIFVRSVGTRGGAARVRYADLWGRREDRVRPGGGASVPSKYAWLASHEIGNTEWREVQPRSPGYLFMPTDMRLRREYEAGWRITDAMPVGVLGFQSHRDHFAIAFSRDEIERRIRELRSLRRRDSELRAAYRLRDNQGWELEAARRRATGDRDWERHVLPCLYRPMDRRWCYLDEAAMDRPRREILLHVAGRENLCLNTVRQTHAPEWRHALASDVAAPALYVEIKDGSTLFPLWLYRDGVGPLFAAVPTSVERAPNFAAQFIAAVERRLERRLSPTADRSSATRFAPSDLFAYLYAVLNSPSFCRRYGSLLRGDFPRVPIAAGWARFRALARLGHALIRCHLVRGEFAGTARYPVAGNDQIARAEFDSSGGGRIWINDRQYFSPVPEDVWRQCLGGYRVAEHWLTDRASRQLAYDELSHFRALIGALGEAAKIAAQIDAAIPDWPLD